MMLTQPIAPRTPGRPVRIALYGRVSTDHQDANNIQASYAPLKKLVEENCDAEVEYILLGDQASGMRIDRNAMTALEQMIEAGGVDVVMAEDLARFHRNVRHQWAFVQDAADAGVRVICPADALDTLESGWEPKTFVATIRHGFAVQDSGRRVRRTADQSFRHGGMVLKTKYGFRRVSKEDAAAGNHGPRGLRIVKDDEAAPVIRAMRDAVLRGDAYDVIAERLNGDGVRPGAYVSKERWTGALVKGLLRDPILKGLRRFRLTEYRKINRSGKYRRIDNKPNAETAVVPELAHLSAEEFDDLQRVMDERAAHWRRASGADNPMTGRPRTQSPWPGQSARCGVCRGPMHRMGKFLRCARALERPARCWNKVQAPIALLNARTVDWIMKSAAKDPRFRGLVGEVVWREQERCGRRRGRTLGVIDERIAALKGEVANLMKAVRKGRDFDELRGELESARAELKALERDREAAVENLECGEFASRKEIEDRLEEVLREEIDVSLELADAFRRIFAAVTIIPLEELNTPQVRPRVVLEADLSRIDGAQVEEGRHSGSIDLFEAPLHIRLLQAVRQLRDADPRLTLTALAKQLGVSDMTVKRTLRYERSMKEAGWTEPYQPLVARPANASRWRRLPGE
jgi:DNA invertase Pin-like site-specific DNA recombinase